MPWDEFNRVPVAGVTNIARLSEMLDAAAIAFLVMTAEDEMADGALQARMNVIHEAGLFQGRLGFSRAVVMLERSPVRKASATSPSTTITSRFASAIFSFPPCR